MRNEIVETVTLDDLAARIIGCSNAADDQLIEAAKLMQQAKTLIEAGDGNGLSWQDWVDQNIKLGRSRINELLQLAKSENPSEALAQLRQANKARQARHREKQKGALPLRNGNDAFEISAPVLPDPESESAPTPQPPIDADGGVAPLCAIVPALEAAVPARSEPARAQLLAWVQTAPIDEVEQVLNYIAGQFGFGAAV